jgi:hypothetical protein
MKIACVAPVAPIAAVAAIAPVAAVAALAALGAAALLPLVLAPPDVAHARIEQLDLRRMLQRTDGAVFAEIAAREVFQAADEPGDGGPGLFFTRLTLDGVRLADGCAIRVDVVHVGGVVAGAHGAFCSEAPSADDTALGTRVVAFYAWVDDLGGGVAGNALYTAQGGLYRAVEGPLGTSVLGRGPGFAVERNVSIPALAEAVRTLTVEQR